MRLGLPDEHVGRRRRPSRRRHQHQGPLLPGQRLDGRRVARRRAAGYEGVELFDGNVVEYADAPDRAHQLAGRHTTSQLVGVYSGANFIFPDVLDSGALADRSAAALAASGARSTSSSAAALRRSSRRRRRYERLGAALDQVVAIAGHLWPDGELSPAPDHDRRDRADRCPGPRPHIDRTLPGYRARDPRRRRPSELIRTHADRIAYLHLKDVDPTTRNSSRWEGVRSTLDAVMDALVQIGYDGWVTVELDMWDDPLAGAQASRRALERWIPAADGP